jgi:uncharacterized protein with PIN domain
MPEERELKKNEYRCAMCKEVFKKGVSDEEAIEEFHKDFPDILIEDTSLICDECYRIITLDIKRKPWKYGL